MGKSDKVKLNYFFKKRRLNDIVIKDGEMMLSTDSAKLISLPDDVSDITNVIFVVDGDNKVIRENKYVDCCSGI